ncbi:hypothetical protein FNH04_42490 [Streptomyces phyllanthi]|uniref:Uncharacterized protein n=1 Tax=Streptomyces phyllanthi TaxID=1803180 RepID=A0A5N8WFT5_9ACTN|nr:hypothetical protein [Streptomyces phyllanthi]
MTPRDYVVHLALPQAPCSSEADEFRTRFRHEPAAARRAGGALTMPVVDADAPRPWAATLHIPHTYDGTARSRRALAGDDPRVIDFGISRAAEFAVSDALNRTGRVMGTPRLMSPSSCRPRRTWAPGRGQGSRRPSRRRRASVRPEDRPRKRSGPGGGIIL